jgi:predicted DNA-binding protein (MmcQ/YjbR family)
MTRLTPLTKSLRAHALRHRQAWEDFPWEEDRVVKVGKKIFVFLGDASLGVKLTHSNQAALGLPSVQPMGYGLGRSGWVTVDLSKRRKPPIDLLKAWIDESYEAVAPKRGSRQARPSGARPTRKGQRP